MVELCRSLTFHGLPKIPFIMGSAGRLATSKLQMMQRYSHKFGAHGVTIEGDPGEGDLAY